MSKRIRIKDIAALAGVSEGTVDRVLHGRSEVAPATRDRILKVVEETGYRPNLLAKSLASKKRIRIAVLVPDSSRDNPYWALPTKGIGKADEEIRAFNGMTETYPFDLNDEASFRMQTTRILENPPDALLVAPIFTKPMAELAVRLEEMGIPFVYLDSQHDGQKALSYIGQNARHSGYLVARLICYGLRSGEKILVANLARPEGIMHHLQKRQRGFMNYFRPCMMRKDIKVLTLDIDLTVEGEPALTLDPWFAEQGEVNAIFVTSSKVHKLAEYLQAKRKEHILLVGYDLIDENRRYLEEGVIDFLISQKPEEQGYKGVMTLFQYLTARVLPDPVQHSPIDIITVENIEYYQP